MKIVALIFLSFVVLGFLAPGAARSDAAPAKTTHIHGLYFGSDGVLHMSGHRGIVRYANDHWARLPGPAYDFSSFSAGHDVMYGSGHRDVGSQNADAQGLKSSIDGGRTWISVPIPAGTVVDKIATGYRSGAVYLVERSSDARRPQMGIHRKTAEGKEWQRAAMRGLSGNIQAIAAHPQEPGIVAVGTTTGLFLSRDSGVTFTRAYSMRRVFSASFERSGDAVWFGTYEHAAKLIRLDLNVDDARKELPLPPMHGDAIAHIAFSPIDSGVVSIATVRRNLFVSRNGGSTWIQLLNEGDPVATTY